MKVKTWISIEQEVDVNISADDIRCALMEDIPADVRDPKDPDHPIMRALSSIYQYLQEIPDVRISEMLPTQRTAYSKFFAEQSERYKIGSD